MELQYVSSQQFGPSHPAPLLSLSRAWVQGMGRNNDLRFVVSKCFDPISKQDRDIQVDSAENQNRRMCCTITVLACMMFECTVFEYLQRSLNRPAR